LNEENKPELVGSQIIGKENVAAPKKQAIGRQVLNWLGYLAVTAAILFFIAPESWWQFGVSSISERKNTANFTLKSINNEEWNFADRRGKVVVVNYWATCVDVHDLHVWGMSTTETALTAHVVMENQACDNALISKTAKELHDRFGIEHTTLQVEFGDPNYPCGCKLV